MSMNKGNKGVHICRVAKIGAPPQGNRPSMAERSQQLRAIVKRMKALENRKAGLADANSKNPLIPGER